MLTLPLAVVVAIVTQDATPLRAAARETAPRQTILWQGDWLEVRGERQGYLQVYDHRHERPGYVRPWQVRSYSVDAELAPGAAAGDADQRRASTARDLAAVIDFVRDTPGAEALGIGYVALFLRAAPPAAVDGAAFDALGTLAERLGRRASSKWARPGDAALAAHLEVAESYGVRFKSFERDGRTRVCYDGEAFRRVLALPSPPEAQARAALALADPACVDPALPQADQLAIAEWRADILGNQVSKLDQHGNLVSMWLQERLRLRLASALAEQAYQRARKGAWPEAARAADAAVHALALVDKSELADDDALAYDEAAVRVGAIRWASNADKGATRGGTEANAGKGAARGGSEANAGDGVTSRWRGPHGLDVSLAAGKPGETCVRVSAGKQRLAEHCTYGVVWPGSLRAAPHGDAVAFAVSPLPSWSELVLLRRGPSGWSAQTLAPAAADPDLGYVELAGWSPDGTRLLVVREARLTGPLGQPGTLAPWLSRSFQIVRADDLVIEKQSSTLANFPSFRRWQTPDWQRDTLALR